MTKLSILPMLLMGTVSFSQSDENEIFRIASIRQNCIERSNFEVSVHPNPSVGPIHIDAPNTSNCQINTTTGVYVGTWEVGETGLDLRDLPTGSYIATIQIDGLRKTKRIIIL